MTSSIVGGPVSAGAWTAIQKGTGAIDISSIPTGYKFLRLIALSNADQNQVLKLNHDAGANYYVAYNSGTQDVATTGPKLWDRGVNTVVALVSIDIINIPTARKLAYAEVTTYETIAHKVCQTSTAITWTNATDEINRIEVDGTPVYWALFGAAL